MYLTRLLNFMAFLGLCLPGIALAHHPLDGEVPNTIGLGLMSGLAHPVIGLDHLVFVLAMAIFAAVIKRKRVILAFVMASILGTILHVNAVDLPAAELVIVSSLLILGLALASFKGLNWIVLTFFTFISGIFHGFAYGEAVVAAEPSPLLAYLVGFTAIQLLIGLSVAMFYMRASSTMQLVLKRSAYGLAIVTGLAMLAI